MPALFILIMSLALKNTYSGSLDVKLNVGIIAVDAKNKKILNDKINEYSSFKSSVINDLSDTNSLIYDKKYDFIVAIPDDYESLIIKNKKDFEISIYSKPDTSNQSYQMLKSAIFESITEQIAEDYLQNKQFLNAINSIKNRIKNLPVYKNEKNKVNINSVQQNVPAWLVFAMFFILIPVSNTFIGEKYLGTIARIRSIYVPLWLIFLGKFIPYFVVNQLQMLVMILVGMFLVPLFGGDKFLISGNYFLILLMSCAISVAAICFALLIANLSKTTEAATSVGGFSNVILAAIGGIMVPKFVMPEFMQNLANYSPMSWALEGLLNILVRGGGFSDIGYNVTYLMTFAIICLILSYLSFVKFLK